MLDSLSKERRIAVILHLYTVLEYSFLYPLASWLSFLDKFTVSFRVDRFTSFHYSCALAAIEYCSPQFPSSSYTITIIMLLI